MKKETTQLLSRAEECLSNAEESFGISMFLVVLNRAYYAAFDAARAMLFESGIETIKTHTGVHAKFSEIFIKTGKMPLEAGDHLRTLFQQRQTGDYDFSAEITEEAAHESLEMARRFLAEARAFFAKSNAF